MSLPRIASSIGRHSFGSSRLLGRPGFIRGMLFVVLALTLMSEPVFAGQLYQLTIIPDLPGGDNISRAYGLNDLGQVVGDSWSDEGQRAILWDEVNGIRELGVLSTVENANFSTGSKITNSGIVVGDSGRTPDMIWDRRIYLWQESTGMVDVGLSHPVGARDINEDGIIAGSFAQIPVVGSPSTGWQTIGPMPSGDDYRYSWAINGMRQVVGIDVTGNIGHDLTFADIKAFIWDESNGLSYLPSLPGGDGDAAPWDINDAGQVVGWSRLADGRHAVLWDPDFGLLDLGDLAGGENASAATDINELGQVVGHGHNDLGGRAMYWDQNVGMLDLNTLVMDLPANFVMTEAREINNFGQIVGLGTLDGSIQRGFLLTPVAVPEASSLVLASTAILGAIAASWRKLRSRKGQEQNVR